MLAAYSSGKRKEMEASVARRPLKMISVIFLFCLLSKFSFNSFYSQFNISTLLTRFKLWKIAFIPWWSLGTWHVPRHEWQQTKSKICQTGGATNALQEKIMFLRYIIWIWILTQIWVRSSGWHWEWLQSAGAERRRHHHWSVQRPPTGWEDSDRDLQRAAGDRVCGELRPCLLYWNNHAPPACLVTIPLFQGRTGDFYFNLKSQNYFFNYHFVKISSKSSLFRRRWHTREK